MKTELFSPALLAQLDKLGRLFIRRRNVLRDGIVAALEVADGQHDSLTQEYHHSQASLGALTAEHDQLNERHDAQAVEFADTRQTLHGVEKALSQSRAQHQHDQQQAQLRFDTISARHAQLIKDRDSVEEARAALELALNEAHETLQQARSEHQREIEHAKARFDTLSSRHAELTLQRNDLEASRQLLENALQQAQVELAASAQTLHALQGLHDQGNRLNAQLTDEIQALKQQHGDTWTRFQLISRLLGARPRESAGLARFRELLANDYMAFAEKESSLAAEAKALTILQSIEQELGVLVGFPDVHERTIVGIVGGFSSGKSEFINSFIDDPQVRLAVGMQPVTAIPSYVLAAEERMIRGYSANGGYMDLDVDFYKSISHAFINSFSFDLKSLMPFMCVGVRMNPDYFSHICFIDTPGYNPPATAAEHSQGDKRTAIQFAQQSDAIVWLIGLDANGTVPDSDLDFIHQIGVEQRSLYVVLTKADLKSEDDIDDVMDEVQDILDAEGITLAGISAYSSTQRREVAYREQSLLEYFSEINAPGDSREHLRNRLKEVFSMYEEAIQQDIDNVRAQKTAINGLRLDSLEIGGVDVYQRMLGPIDKLDSKLDYAPLVDSLKESRQLLESFTAAVDLTANAPETEI